MKKLFILFLFVINLTFGQSNLILPQSANTFVAGNILKTGSEVQGYNHTNGTIGIGTYVSGTSAFLQTHTAHSLDFAVNNGSAAMTLSYSTTPNLNRNIGINTSTPAEKLHVVGNIRSSSLAGTGVRNVSADANGTLTTTTQTSYYSLSAINFKPYYNYNNTNDQYSYHLRGLMTFTSNTSTNFAISPVNLPNGAIITSVTFYYVNDNPNKKLKFTLYTLSHTNVIEDDIFQGITTVTSSSINAPSSFNVPLTDATLTTINNLTKSYYIQVEPILNNGTSTFWDFQNGFPETFMGVKGVVITYTE